MMEHAMHRPSMQRGAALAIALVLLLVMSLLGVSIMQTSGLQERMAGHSSNRALAFQGAEAGLTEAERRLSVDQAFHNAATTGTSGWHDAQAMPDLLETAPTYEASMAMRQRITDSQQGLEIGSDLRFRCIYRVDAESGGGTDEAQVRLRSYFQPRPECEL